MFTLEMQDASLGYGHRPVLSGLNFKLHSGELVGLIGPNGCGKSTIIRAFSRVINALSGKVLLNGQDITCIPRRDLARIIGVVPQIPLLPSVFTAFEIVLMGRNPHLGTFQSEGAKENAIAWQAMARTGTQHLALRRVNELSGGEIQCVLIARVLTQQTGAILLDEPTANLDIGRQGEILDLVKSLCVENNVAVLAAIHDLNLAAQYADRLIMIDRGGIYAEGTPAEVITGENIAAVYGAESCVFPHPVNGLPTVLLSADHHCPSALAEITQESRSVRRG